MLWRRGTGQVSKIETTIRFGGRPALLKRERGQRAGDLPDFACAGPQGSQTTAAMWYILNVHG
jgi:hypothetical protein